MISSEITVCEQDISGEVAAACLDGVSFAMRSSSTSAVDAAQPTVFHYFENAGVLHGSYCGDTVLEGRFAGVREGSTVRISYNHRSINGALVHGNAVSVISRAPSGKLRLTEFYRTSSDQPALSICEEVAATTIGACE